MLDVSNELLSILQKLRDKNGNAIDPKDLNGIVTQLVRAVESNNSKVYEGIKGIGDSIERTKNELLDEEESAVSDATMQLDAVIKHTEEATDKILDAVENIQEITNELPDKESVDIINKHISDIFEACNFQDLTGQRIKKVTNTLNEIEKTVGGLLGSLKIEKNDTRADAQLMDGPQMDQDKPSQDDVDKLFDSM